MIKIENAEVVGWEPAIRGMRNPLESWEQSDSYWNYISADWDDDFGELKNGFVVGPKDLTLMKKLCKAGTDHRKFMRMIVCYCDIVAPLYWWKEFDTYRNGVEKNSCSTMHCIHKKEFELDDFSSEKLVDMYHTSEETYYYEDYSSATPVWLLKCTVQLLNHLRKLYMKKGDKKWWWQMIQLLPSSYNQRRTCMISYEALANMYHARKNHKLDEWREFCHWIESLPYSELITGEAKHDGEE